MVAVTASELKLWKSKYAIFTHKVDGENGYYVEGYEDVHVSYARPFLARLKYLKACNSDGNTT